MGSLSNECPGIREKKTDRNTERRRPSVRTVTAVRQPQAKEWFGPPEPETIENGSRSTRTFQRSTTLQTL